MAVNRYAELHPSELGALIREDAPAILPWGALEWHGPHLPLGLDGLVAEAFAERLADRTGGILFPTMWWATTTLPHPLSLQLPASLFEALVEAMLGELLKVGFRRVAIVSGHYAQPHELLLMDAAEAAMEEGLLVLAAPPLALLNETYLDHAARWETGQLLAVRPDLVRLERLDALNVANAREAPDRTAVLGEDPRETATPAEGEAILERALEEWAKRLATLSPAWLTEFYRRRRAAYNTWLERYFEGNWETALEMWWQELVGSRED